MEFVLLLPQKAAALFLGRSPWHKQCWKVNSYWAEKKPPFWGGHMPKQINSGSQLQHHVPTCRAVGICNTPLLGLVWYPLVPHSSWGKTELPAVLQQMSCSAEYALFSFPHFSNRAIHNCTQPGHTEPWRLGLPRRLNSPSPVFTPHFYTQTQQRSQKQMWFEIILALVHRC